MTNKSTSWKQKIDPAFDTLIRAFVTALDLMEEPSDLAINDLQKRMKQSAIRSFKRFYEDEYKNGANIFDLSSVSNVKQMGKTLRKLEESIISKNNRKLYKTLISLADDLPTISNEYYQRVFKFLSSAAGEKEFIDGMSKEKLAKYIKEFQADLNSLVMHKVIHSLSNSELQAEKKELAGKLGAEYILSLSFNLLDKISLLSNRKSLRALYTEAKNGDPASLIELLKIDKTLFDHEWVRELMFNAMLTGDDNFFSKVGQAIKSDPPLGKLKRGKMKHILFYFWNMGLHRLTSPQLMQLLEDSGLDVHIDPISFRKFIDREIKPLFT